MYKRQVLRGCPRAILTFRRVPVTGTGLLARLVWLGDTGAVSYTHLLAVERDRKIDAAKDTYTTTALPVQNRVKELEGQVKAFVDGHLSLIHIFAVALNNIAAETFAVHSELSPIASVDEHS